MVECVVLAEPLADSVPEAEEDCVTEPEVEGEAGGLSVVLTVAERLRVPLAVSLPEGEGVVVTVPELDSNGVAEQLADNVPGAEPDPLGDGKEENDTEADGETEGDSDAVAETVAGMELVGRGEDEAETEAEAEAEAEDAGVFVGKDASADAEAESDGEFVALGEDEAAAEADASADNEAVGNGEFVTLAEDEAAGEADDLAEAEEAGVTEANDASADAETEGDADFEAEADLEPLADAETVHDALAEAVGARVGTPSPRKTHVPLVALQMKFFLHKTSAPAVASGTHRAAALPAKGAQLGLAESPGRHLSAKICAASGTHAETAPGEDSE